MKVNVLQPLLMHR